MWLKKRKYPDVAFLHCINLPGGYALESGERKKRKAEDFWATALMRFWYAGNAVCTEESQKIPLPFFRESIRKRRSRKRVGTCKGDEDGGDREEIALSNTDTLKSLRFIHFTETSASFRLPTNQFVSPPTTVTSILVIVIVSYLSLFLFISLCNSANCHLEIFPQASRLSEGVALCVYWFF